NMAASGLPPEDQLRCQICKNIFTSPVTLPCGDNLCKTCIPREWDHSVHCRCPICKEEFDKRPQLQPNQDLSKMAACLKKSKDVNVNSTQSQQKVATLGDISCDECTGLKLKAVKSCLVCLASYCETHLKPHLMTKGLKKHQLLDPVENLEARMCSYHNKPLELFCRTDQTFTCMLCTLLDHKEHDYLPLSEEAEQKRSVLRGTEETLNRMIQERRGKMQDLRHTSRLNQEAADGKAAVGLQVFTDLKQNLQTGLDELLKNIEIKQVTAERLTERLIAELGQEVKVLMQSSADVQVLSSSADHAHVLRSFSSINNIPAMKDWSDVSVQIPLYEEMVRKAVVEAVDQLQATFKKEKAKLKEAELKRVQKFKVNLTLDPQTADPWLIVSDDGKQVRLGDFKKSVPDLPKRFNPGGGVVAQQSFGFGRFYFEVQVTDMMKYDLGVVYESINRKKKITNSQESGHWILSLRKENEYKARASHEIPLSLTHRPQRIGLFVDYEEGLVSFYDVGIAELIFSFTDCIFTERLYPFFNPGHGSRSSASLKIVYSMNYQS
uniref:Uncharacterized protein n=1 Tax=Poecilia formosa TaxID=48698 RepID=A0A087XMH5_POEFO